MEGTVVWEEYGNDVCTDSALHDHVFWSCEEERQRYSETDRDGEDIFSVALYKEGYVGFGHEKMEQEHSI